MSIRNVCFHGEIRNISSRYLSYLELCSELSFEDDPKDTPHFQTKNKYFHTDKN